MKEDKKYNEKNIQALEMAEHIRLRPGMYLGIVDSRGFINVISGIICEIIEDSNISNELEIRINDNNSGVINIKSENGVIKNHWYKTKENWNPTYGNLYFLELYVLNALSKSFSVELLDSNGQIFSIENYVEGKPVSSFSSEYHTSEVNINFEADKSIWGNEFSINKHYLNHRLKEIAYLNSKLKVKVKYEIDGEQNHIIHKYHNGLRDRFEIEQLNGLGKCFLESHVKAKLSNIDMEVVYGFRELSVDEPFIKSYVNHFYTSENGTHIDAVLKGLTFGTMKYFQKFDLVDKYKISEKGIKEILVAFVHLKYSEPVFSGCVKNKLANSEIEKPISDYISEYFYQQLLANEDETQKLIRNFEM